MDMDGTRLPLSYRRQFPRLKGLQITSTMSCFELHHLPITKLTMVQRARDSNFSFTNRDTIRKLPFLTHLQIISHGVFGLETPVVDFDSLPALRYLRLSQQYHGHAFTYLGTPDRLLIVGLHCIRIFASFLGRCRSLVHLQISTSMEGTFPTQFPSLQLLEMYDTPSRSALESDLPNLRYFYEYQCMPSPSEMAQDPVRPLRKLKLTTAILQSPRYFYDNETRYRNLLKGVDGLYDQGAVQQAFLWAHMSFADETRPWGTIYHDRHHQLERKVAQLAEIDSAQSFLQTRMYQQSRAEARQKRRRNPLEDIFERSVERECQWTRERACQRHSSMDILRLLS